MVSSEDPAHPAFSINTDYNVTSNAGKGWLSRKFCDYPQTLGIKFDCSIKVKTLQFLCHEHCIASRVEISYLPMEATNGTDFIRVGHFNFQNSVEREKSLHPVRELKSVHFNATAKQIQLTMYDPYHHKDNIFSQVGLISVSVIGEPLGGIPIT